MPGFSEEESEVYAGTVALDNAVEILNNPLRRNEFATICKSICENAINGTHSTTHVRNQDAYDLCDLLDFIAHTHAIGEELRHNVESFIQTVDIELSKADMWELVESWYRLVFASEDVDEYQDACARYNSYLHRKSYDTNTDFGNSEHISFVIPPPATVVAIVENSIEVMQEKKMESSDFTIEQLQAMLAAKQEEAKTKRESALFTALEAFYRDGGKWEDVSRISRLVTKAIEKPEVKPKALKAAKEHKGPNVFIMATKLDKLISMIKKFTDKFEFAKAKLGTFEEYRNSWKGINWKNDMEKSKHLDTIVAKLQSDCTYEDFVAAIMENQQ